MDGIFMILRIKLIPGVYLSLPSGLNKFIGIYPRSQVSVYMNIGHLVSFFQNETTRVREIYFQDEMTRNQPGSSVCRNTFWFSALMYRHE